ncbi:MAG: FecR domain-containing protein [Balneolaceae bacterium]|nr:FecR domain-containing protein [Balneolaceae bacterium]
MATQLPDSDKDLQIARRVGELLREGRPTDQVDDPLVRELAAYKRRYRKSQTAADAETLWQHISEEMQQGEQDESVTPISIFPHTTMRWAAAAVILLAALAGIYYFQVLQQPVLLADSGSEIMAVELADGSRVTLRPHSSLYELEVTESRHLYRLAGEAFFNVQHNSRRRFEVESGPGRIRVLGTRFTVSSWGDQTQVYLQEGSVEFAGPSGTNTLELSPGQAATLAAGRQQPRLAEISESEVTDWLRDELVFNNRTAEYVFGEVEQHFNIELEASTGVQESSLSGSISLEDREAVLNSLALSLNGRFEQTGERSYRFTPADE